MKGFFKVAGGVQSIVNIEIEKNKIARVIHTETIPVSWTSRQATLAQECLDIMPFSPLR